MQVMCKVHARGSARMLKRGLKTVLYCLQKQLIIAVDALQNQTRKAQLSSALLVRDLLNAGVICAAGGVIMFLRSPPGGRSPGMRLSVRGATN
jgi:hypothetical protein